jgi:hypothetical protein
MSEEPCRRKRVLALYSGLKDKPINQAGSKAEINSFPVSKKEENFLARFVMKKITV